MNGLRTLNDDVRIQAGVVSRMPVTNVLIKSDQPAHTKYKKEE